MKKANWILFCIAVFFSMGVFLFITSAAQTQDVSKPAVSSEQQDKIRETIKNSQDLIWLDSDTKGEFAWVGLFHYVGEWHYYSLVCGEGDLEIYLINIPQDSDFDLYLFDCNGWELARSDSSGNSNESIIYSVTPDTYTIGVYCYSGSGYYTLYGYYVTPPKLPDLVLQSLTASDYNPGIGDTITITLTVKNQGDTIAYWFYTDLFLDEIIPPSPPAVGDHYWETYELNPGNTDQFTQRVTNNESEIWHMYGLTDSDGDLYEKNECNNLEGPVDVTWTLPDLVVEEFTVSDSSPFMDEFIDVTVTIRNQGGQIDETFRTDLYYNLSNPPAPYTPGDELFYKNGLASGESYYHTFYNIPYQSPYLWHMWVYVDSWRNVSESDDDNNIAGPVSIFWREHPISDNYGWPIHPSNQQHEISGTFMEWRSGGTYGHHYHDGIDIPAPANTPVYSVSAGQVTYNPNEPDALRVSNFWYKHLKNIEVTNGWINSDLLIAQTDSLNHVHFCDGPNQQEVNPLREHGIDPFDDSIDPIFYDDAVTLREDDPYVGGSNGGADGQIISKDSVYGNVDIIVHVKDEIDAGRRVGPYAISYTVCDENCYPLTGEIVNFRFDQWCGNYYVNFIYADTFSYIIITNQITANGYWRTWDFEDGTYCLRINAYDIVSFYKKFVLGDTTKLNVEYYYLEDIELKNGINHNPEIVGHLDCRFPQEECCNCIKPNQEITIQISAYDEDEGDTLRYEWFCWSGAGYFLPGGVIWIATEDSFVTYVTPSTPDSNYELWVYVFDNHVGWTSLESNFDVYEEGYPCLCGDANNDGLVTAGDIVYLIVYLNRGGAPPPDPYLRGDANNNCEVEAGDVVYLISYLFRQGPPPECCWFRPN